GTDAGGRVQSPDQFAGARDFHSNPQRDGGRLSRCDRNARRDCSLVRQQRPKLLDLGGVSCADRMVRAAPMVACQRATVFCGSVNFKNNARNLSMRAHACPTLVNVNDVWRVWMGVPPSAPIGSANLPKNGCCLSSSCGIL